MSEVNKLAPSEIEKLKGFMRKYADFYKKVEALSTKVEEIDSQKAETLAEITKIANELENLRVEEDSYQQTLVAKYGEFHLNLETFEYKTA